MSLFDRISSLLSYANETTGKADTTLGDAVRTLADGYGQGGTDESLLFMVKGAKTSGEAAGGVIDTGVPLGAYTDWTFTAEFETNNASAGNFCIFHCMNEATGYAGFTIDRLTHGVKLRMAVGAEVLQLYNRDVATAVNKIVVRCRNNVISVFTDDRHSNGYTFSARFDTAAYPNVTLVVGGYKPTTGAYGRYAEVHNVNVSVYSRAFTDAECKAYFD